MRLLILMLLFQVVISITGCSARTVAESGKGMQMGAMASSNAGVLAVPIFVAGIITEKVAGSVAGDEGPADMAKNENKGRPVSSFLGEAPVLQAKDIDIIKKSVGKEMIGIGHFESSESGLDRVSCRVFTTISPPKGLTFAALVKQGTITQFQAARNYAGDFYKPSIVLTGRLKEVDLSTYGGSWKFLLEVVSSNGNLVKVEHEHEFSSAISGGEACARAQEALIPAVTGLVAKFINSPDFPRLFEAKIHEANNTEK